MPRYQGVKQFLGVKVSMDILTLQLIERVLKLGPLGVRELQGERVKVKAERALLCPCVDTKCE